MVGTTGGIARLQHRLATFPEAGLRFGSGYDPTSRDGRGGVERGPSDLDFAVRAAKHIATAFDRIKLKPAFGDTFYQPIPWLLADGKNKDGKRKPLRRRAYKRDKHVTPSGHSGKRHGHLRKHRVHKRRF